MCCAGEVPRRPLVCWEASCRNPSASWLLLLEPWIYPARSVPVCPEPSPPPAGFPSCHPVSVQELNTKWEQLLHEEVFAL